MESFSSGHHNWSDPRPPCVSKASKEKKLKMMQLRRTWNAGLLIRRPGAQSTTLAKRDAVDGRLPPRSPIEVIDGNDQYHHDNADSSRALTSGDSKGKRQDDVSLAAAHDQIVENGLVARFWNHLHPPPHLLGDKEALLAFYLDEWSPGTVSSIRSAAAAKEPSRGKEINRAARAKDYDSDMDVSSGSEPEK